MSKLNLEFAFDLAEYRRLVGLAPQVSSYQDARQTPRASRYQNAHELIEQAIGLRKSPPKVAKTDSRLSEKSAPRRKPTYRELYTENQSLRRANVKLQEDNDRLRSCGGHEPPSLRYAPSRSTSSPTGPAPWDMGTDVDTILREAAVPYREPRRAGPIHVAYRPTPAASTRPGSPSNSVPIAPVRPDELLSRRSLCGIPPDTIDTPSRPERNAAPGRFAGLDLEEGAPIRARDPEDLPRFRGLDLPEA